MDKSLLVAGVCAVALWGQVEAAVLRGCPASVPLGTFQLTVQPAGKGEPRPARQVNAIERGQKLLYTPVESAARVRQEGARLADFHSGRLRMPS